MEGTVRNCRAEVPTTSARIGGIGAHEWNRTIDLLLTKGGALYRLSYVSVYFSSRPGPRRANPHPCRTLPPFSNPKWRRMVSSCRHERRPAIAPERETGIEPAQSAWKAEVLPLNYSRPEHTRIEMVEGGGFEPPKASADLQSAPLPLGYPPISLRSFSNPNLRHEAARDTREPVILDLPTTALGQAPRRNFTPSLSLRGRCIRTEPRDFRTPPP